MSGTFGKVAKLVTNWQFILGTLVGAAIMYYFNQFSGGSGRSYLEYLPMFKRRASALPVQVVEFAEPEVDYDLSEEGNADDEIEK